MIEILISGVLTIFIGTIFYRIVIIKVESVDDKIQVLAERIDNSESSDCHHVRTLALEFYQIYPMTANQAKKMVKLEKKIKALLTIKES
jgi:hypothetical protein